MRSIDINCDMGESFGPWKMGDDEVIMPFITSANVACGGHAGDPNVMLATVRLAKRHGVAVGAHPGYFDMRYFGRRSLGLTEDEVTAMMLYQIGALAAIASSEAVTLAHVKPHGALYNQACSDAGLAGAIARSVAAFSHSLSLFGLPGSELEKAAAETGLNFYREGFADRRYEPNGSLRDRKHADALITDPSRAAKNALGLVLGEIAAVDGTPLNLNIDTICIHGDTPGAAHIAETVNSTLRASGILLGNASA